MKLPVYTAVCVDAEGNQVDVHTEAPNADAAWDNAEAEGLQVLSVSLFKSAALNEYDHERALELGREAQREEEQAAFESLWDAALGEGRC